MDTNNEKWIDQQHEISFKELRERDIDWKELLNSGDWQQFPLSDFMMRTRQGREKWWAKNGY